MEAVRCGVSDQGAVIHMGDLHQLDAIADVLVGTLNMSPEQTNEVLIQPLVLQAFAVVQVQHLAGCLSLRSTPTRAPSASAAALQPYSPTALALRRSAVAASLVLLPIAVS